MDLKDDDVLSTISGFTDLTIVEPNRSNQMIFNDYDRKYASHVIKPRDRKYKRSDRNIERDRKLFPVNILNHTYNPQRDKSYQTEYTRRLMNTPWRCELCDILLNLNTKKKHVYTEKHLLNSIIKNGNNSKSTS